MKPWNNYLVKKIVLILLLCWMPVQACLAAFEEVNAHHDHTAAHGTHASEVGPATDNTLDEESLGVDCSADCVTSHLCMSQLLFLQTTRESALGSPSVANFNSSSFALLDRASERPERPQWVASSH
ncbi:MAG: hypothetical protein ACRCWJ_14725 [Casimicrobium sp.]